MTPQEIKELREQIALANDCDGIHPFIDFTLQEGPKILDALEEAYDTIKCLQERLDYSDSENHFKRLS